MTSEGVSESSDQIDAMIDPPTTLVANHPLLERFQRALFDHLTHINEQLGSEIDIIDGKVDVLNEKREEIGSNLFDLQVGIERQRDAIDAHNTRVSEMFEKRTKCEYENRQMKRNLQDLQDNYRNIKRMHSDRVVELSKLQSVEQNVEKWQMEMQNDVKTSKQILNKNKQDKKRYTEEKQKKDLLLLNLELELRRRQTESTLIVEQIESQEKKLELMNTKLADANADMEVLQSEHRRLIGSWNDVIYAISNRDKLLTRINHNLEEEHEKIRCIQTTIDGTKKEALKLMEQNETLEEFKQRLQQDLSHSNKQFGKASQENAEIMEKMGKLTMLLSEIDTTITKAKVENHILDGNLKNLFRANEKVVNDKFIQENAILELLQDQITTDQASKVRGQKIYELQSKRRELEIMMCTNEAQLSEILFELEKIKGIVTRCKTHAEELKVDQLAVEEKSKDYDKELNSVQKLIETKEKLMERLNRQLAKLISEAGGTERDPLELKIYDFEKTIMELEVDIKNDRNQWMRHQSNVVKMSEDLNNELNELHLARKQLLIIDQKSLKVDADVEALKNDVHKIDRDIEKSISNIGVLDSKLFAKKQSNQMEKKQCELIYDNMMDKLREDEFKVIQMEDKEQMLTNEIEELKNRVVEKHREALSWERKWKMVEEAKRQRDAEYKKSSEIGAMNSEIHRMEVRYSQLKRAQEKLVSDMEHCVQHRDHIFTEANLRNKLPLAKSKVVDTMQYRINDLKAKLKQVRNEISTSQKQGPNLSAEKEFAEAELTKLNQIIESERTQYALLQNDIEQAILLKQKNLDSIVRLQHRAKRYRCFSVATQIPKVRSEAAIDIHMDRHEEVNEHLVSVLEKLLAEFPDQKFPIQRVLQTLKT